MEAGRGSAGIGFAKERGFGGAGEIPGSTGTGLAGARVRCLG